MTQLGIGAMLKQLAGNEETVAAYNAALNRVIKEIILKEETLFINFDDGYQLRAWDDGQSCCESRYMRSDDNPSDFIGATFIGAELKDAPEIEDQWGSHEVQFLEIKTSNGSFTVSNHNEHNGYYGGFGIELRFIKLTP